MASGITSIRYVSDLGATPASVNRVTGEVLINLRMWRLMPFEHRVFILLHEWAHIARQTTDEFSADELAFRVYSQNGFSLKESIKALSAVLNFSNEEHLPRLYQQYLRACDYDYRVNGNKEATPIY